MRSEIARFHDQEHADFDPETMTVLNPEIEKHREKIAKAEKLERIEKIGSSSETEKHLKYVVSLINNAELSSFYKEDENQKSILEKNKVQAKKLLQNVLNKVEEYINLIRAVDETKIQRENLSQKDYSRELENIEKTRTIKHDALIADINVVNRFILNNFGDIGEENVEEWEEREETAGRDILHAKRINFPSNVICSEKINMKDRKQITDWAMQMYDSLSEIRKELS